MCCATSSVYMFALCGLHLCINYRYFCFVPVASVGPSTTSVCSSAEASAVGSGSIGLGQVISPTKVHEQKGLIFL